MNNIKTSSKINTVYPFPALTAPVPLIFISIFLLALEVKLLTNPGKLSFLNYLTNNQKIHLIFDVPLLHISVKINESKEKLRTVFCCFSAIKTLLHHHLILIKINLWSNLFVLINLYQWFYICDDTNHLTNFLLYSHHFFTFR